MYKKKKIDSIVTGQGNCDINLHVHQDRQTREFVEL